MKKEDPYRVQAQLQKQRLKKVTSEEEVPVTEERQDSSLPSRSTVHKNKKKKLKIPIISLLAFLFILLPVAVLLVLNGKDISNLLSTENTSGVFENVNIQKGYSPNNKTTPDDSDNNQDELVIVSNSTVKKEEEIPEDNLKEKAEEKAEEKEKEAEKQKEQKEQKEQKQRSEKKIDKEQKQKQKEKEENSSQTNPNEKIVYHTVAKGENLYRIALKYYPNGDGMGKIKAANNMTTDQVQLGQTLKIIIEP
ncbi:peptidoglycan-binding protein [Niallia circulans]|uniref:LysM peptidoglycan-binding domain-containing protein n=1 Tax=Niallia TaxID=2837506 RepID=UPI00077C9242|nr:LysM peptidoglycan-binding domain-containing protein [Niallia circulans]MCM2980970.1 LysM peptidoglycan-binding domain-containing protein [Niallia circulans]MDR4314578.1 LysM peptidoglycan-binding domain-containing protein [Niallia circulans]MED3840786.1 LysM peptidoglycan-binding domain-containing protein [Niallia circulans]MED4242740.1 LysM peptidoglycan-binding domain-containing protein [Niallia circulans]MED4246718.1 LysM peptidoglycan-binding domain-containing protein [Niallia circulan